MPFRFALPSSDAIPITLVPAGAALDALEGLAADQHNLARELGFETKAGRHVLMPATTTSKARVLFATEPSSARGHDPFAPGRLVALLPAGVYRLEGQGAEIEAAALGWALSSYRFSRYKKAAPTPLPGLCRPDGVEAARLEAQVEAVFFGRDLINTPANDLGPEALERAARDLAARHGAEIRVVQGLELESDFPLIHAVGVAAHQPPRLIDITWGRADAPKITLVGKGVTFDTGGLNIKPDAGMLLMKKDMGGAATALAAGAMIMDAGLPLRLRLLVPVVENAISASSFRPGDVLRSRKGLTVEIGNTDAEGRLILADALALACEEQPELVIDFATLTGAARVALGPDLPPLFTDDDQLAEALLAKGREIQDPVWRMPLWNRYDASLDGKVGDISNTGGSPHGGSITAALFLRRFVEPGIAWAHLDIFGWVPVTRPGRPEGGEVMTARLIFHYLAERYPA